MKIPGCYDPVLQAERLAMEEDKLMERAIRCQVCRSTLYPGCKYHSYRNTIVCASCLEGLQEDYEIVI